MPLTLRLNIKGHRGLNHMNLPTLGTCPPTCFYTGHDDSIQKYYVKQSLKKKSKYFWFLKKNFNENLSFTINV